MSRRYPIIRVSTEFGHLGTHDALTLKFFLPSPHREVAQRVWRTLSTFLEAIAPNTLKWYVSMEGEWEALDEAGWNAVYQGTFQEPLSRGGGARLADAYDSELEYAFEYAGYWGLPVCGVGFTLPTAYLERQGPEHVRALALALATELPFSFGYASLALIPGPLMQQATRVLLRSYPGLDMCHLDSATATIGTGARGAYWLTFLGSPLLGQLGGMEALRQHLSFPDISFHSLDAERVLLTVGEWPSLAENGAAPSLCALARLLEPFFPKEKIAHISLEQEDSDGWLRRFCG